MGGLIEFTGGSYALMSSRGAAHEHGVPGVVVGRVGVLLAAGVLNAWPTVPTDDVRGVCIPAG